MPICIHIMCSSAIDQHRRQRMVRLTFLVQILPIANRNDLVLGPVHDEHGRFHFSDLGNGRTEDAVGDEIFHGREDNAGARREWTHQNHPNGPDSCPQIDCRSCPQRFPVENNPVGRHLELLNDPVVHC